MVLYAQTEGWWFSAATPERKLRDIEPEKSNNNIDHNNIAFSFSNYRGHISLSTYPFSSYFAWRVHPK